MSQLDEISEKQISEKTRLMMVLIGTNVKKQRGVKEMSRIDLAYCAKTTESVICNIENGNKEGITVYSMVKLSEALGIDLFLLFCE